MARKITRLDDNFTNINHLPKFKNGKTDWLKSVGEKIEFKYCGINGVLEIIGATRKNKKTFLDIQYNNKIFHIETAVIQRCKLGKIVDDKDNNALIKWRYDIGDKVIDDIFIIGRKFENSTQYYKITCNKCGFKSQGYYVVKNKELKYYEEYWVDSDVLYTKKGCPCCSKKSSIVVPGINDIATTDFWMIDYFVNKCDSQKYSSGSNSDILMKCKDCNHERLYKLSRLKEYGHLPCSCNDNYSLPNKFSYFLFKDMVGIENYKREYNPDWLKPYYYDNYFEYNGKKYVVEMDGGLGHGKKIFGSSQKDIEGLKRDKIKDKLAKSHGITVIRINSEKSDLNFLKENTIKMLSGIIDLSNVNWEYVYQNATSNMVKRVCEYANQHYSFIGNKLVESKYITEISHKFDIANLTVVRFLKVGRGLGWCNYISYIERAKDIEDKVYELYQQNRNQGYESIAQQLGIEIWDVANATKKLIKNNKIIARRQKYA